MTQHNNRYFWGPDVAAVLKIPNPDCTKCSGTGRVPMERGSVAWAPRERGAVAWAQMMCNYWDDDDK